MMKFKCIQCKKTSEFPLSELEGLAEAPPCPHCPMGFLLVVSVEGPRR